MKHSTLNILCKICIESSFLVGKKVLQDTNLGIKSMIEYDRICGLGRVSACQRNWMVGTAVRRKTKDKSNGVVEPPYQMESENCVNGTDDAANCANQPAPIAARYCTSVVSSHCKIKMLGLEQGFSASFHISALKKGKKILLSNHRKGSKNISPNMYRSRLSGKPHLLCSPTIQHSNVLNNKDVAAPPRSRPTIRTP